MNNKNKKDLSCSKCLELFLTLEDNDEKEWRKVGKGLPHCTDCKAALKEKLYLYKSSQAIKSASMC